MGFYPHKGFKVAHYPNFTLFSMKIAASRTGLLGGTVATVGFPDTGLQGFAPKLAKGKSRRCPARGMTRCIFKSACRCSRAIRAGRWWMSGAMLEFKL
jgi:hypothetical protein